jgi:hypothetical protein
MRTFPVSDVERVVTRLPATTLEARLEALGFREREAFRVSAGELVVAPPVHPLAAAVDLAFGQHRPLVLTPDAVWLCLAQSLGLHVERNAEQLRGRLVRHTGKLELKEERHDFRRGNPANDWAGAVDGLVAQMRGHLGGRADLFVADFSTTGPLERTASQIALMSAMQHYFSYSVYTLCGIPEVTLAGTPEDWASIRRRVAAFGELDLGWWVAALDPVIAQLEATARGAIDREFWRSMYKAESQSGGDRSTGWFTSLFAYLGTKPERNRFDPFDARRGGYTLSAFPPGRSTAPFTWRYLGERLEMALVGGMWGVTQDAEGRLGVATGWVVAPATDEPVTIELDWP